MWLPQGAQETVVCYLAGAQTVGKLSYESGQGRDTECCFSNAHRQQETLLCPGSLNNLGAHLQKPSGQGPETPGFESWLLPACWGRSLNPFGPGAPPGADTLPLLLSFCFFLGATHLSLHSLGEGPTLLPLRGSIWPRPARSAYPLPWLL